MTCSAESMLSRLSVLKVGVGRMGQKGTSMRAKKKVRFGNGIKI